MFMEKLYKRILNDKNIIELYDKIHESEVEQGNYAHHDYRHAIRVAGYCEKILRSLGYGEDIVCSAKVAAILHDTGALQGKQNHAQRSYEFAKKYFKENNIKLNNESMILEAIKNHSDGFDTDNIIQLVLVLADKLDLTKARVSDAGKLVEGIRQYGYVEDIQFEISNGIFNINFICDDKINLEELNNYYFTKKIFKAIQAFSVKYSLQPQVCIGGKPWSEFYKN